MLLKNKNVLIFTRSMQCGGTENVIIQLCEILSNKVNKIVVCSNGGVNEKKLQLMGIKHVWIPDIESKSVITLLKTLRIVKRVVKEENIDIIHTHHRMAAFYVSFFKLYKKITFISTAHNTFNNKIKLTKFAYKHSYIIACGVHVKENLINTFGLSSSQVSVIPNAVKPFDFNVQKDPLIEELRAKNNFIVANVGRLSEQKGMEYYIQSIHGVIKKHPKTSFLIIGSGEDEKKLKELSTCIGVNNHLYFMGYRDDIQNILSQVDLVVLSSLWEGLPLTPIEAFSVKKVVIATAVDGTSEIISNFKNGLLIEKKNFNQISKSINYIIENPTIRSQMEVYAYQTYLKYFSFETFSQKYLKIYERRISL